MSNETIVTIVGNLVADPELRFTGSGAAVANFTVASTPRNYNKNTGQWEDGDALFMRCSLWRDAAENVAESLTKGTRVIVQGRMTQRNYTDKHGNNRSSIEMQVDEVGPSLRYAKAKVTRAGKNGNQTQGGNTQWGAPAGGSQNDPWANSQVDWNADPNGEPPF